MSDITKARVEIAVRLRVARQLLKEAAAVAKKHGDLNMAREQIAEVEEDIRIVQRLLVTNESETSNG